MPRPEHLLVFPNSYLSDAHSAAPLAAQLTPKLSQFSADPLTPLSLGLFFCGVGFFLFFSCHPDCTGS